MHRRIYEQLFKIKTFEQDCSGEAIDYLRTHFFREFYIHSDMKELVQNLALHQYRDKQVLFLQGAPIDRYYFLLTGRVILSERFLKPNERAEKQLLDREGIIGQFFYDVSTRRQQKAQTLPFQHSTLILSIEKKIFNRICAKKMDEYHQLKERLSNLSQISKQNLESKGLYRHLGFKKYRIGDWISSREFGNVVCYILEGQCLYSSSKGMITLIADDCLNLQSYFNRGLKNEFKYRVISSKVQLLTLSFEYVDRLPQSFIQKLSFLYQSHQNAVKMIKNSSKIHFKELTNLEQVPYQRKSSLPKVQSTSNSSLFLNKGEIYSKVKSHIRTKSKSVAIFEQQLENLSSFRNEYSLLTKTDLKQESLPKVQLRQPKGYFNLQVVHKAKIEVKESKRRQWAAYYREKSKQKETKKLKKKRNKFVLKQMLTTSKSNVFFESLFKRKEMSQNLTPEKFEPSSLQEQIKQKIRQSLHKKH